MQVLSTVLSLSVLCCSTGVSVADTQAECACAGIHGWSNRQMSKTKA